MCWWHVIRQVDQYKGVRCPGPNWPSGSSALPNGRGQVPQMASRWTAIAIRSGHWGRDGGKGSPLLPQGLGLTSGWLWRGLWSPSGHSPKPVLFPELSSSPASLRRGELEGPGRRPGSPSYLSLRLTTITPSLTVACLGEGPTAVLTSGWAAPLMDPQ